MFMLNKKVPKIGLALGSGGAKGYAHVGVIKVLEKNKIPIDFIAGSSIGAMIGCLYSFFRNSYELEKIIFSTSWRQIISLIDPSFKGGLIEGKKIKEFIDNVIKRATFSQLKMPFKAVATDFKTAQLVELSKGNVASAVRASISLPLIFKPVLWQNKLLWDGGLSSPVPTDTVRKMGANIVIAVNLDNKSCFNNKRLSKTNPYSMALKSVQFLQYHLAKECLKTADVVIEPSVGSLSLINWQNFLKGRGENVILEGEKSTKVILPRIKRLIKEKTL